LGERLVRERKRYKAQRRANPDEFDVDLHEHLNWDFPVAFALHPGEGGLPEDLDHPHEIDIRSICGGIDESQPVEQYDGTLGVTRAFVAAHQRPVGQLQWNDNLARIYTNPGTVSGQRWASGTLISGDLFLTAGHNFDVDPPGWTVPRDNTTGNPIPPADIATNMHVNFDFQVDPDGNPRPEQRFAITQLVEHRLGGIDFAIVRLAGNPGAIFGRTRISLTDARFGQMLCIIGHPAGLPKHIEAGPCLHLHGTRIGYDSIDTLGGNSGSGVLRAADGRIVGVHTNGGCDDDAVGHNHGQRITSVRAASPTLQTLLAWWESLGGQLAGSPGAVLQTGGRLVVFARGTDNQVWHRWQVTRNGDWSGWESLGAPPGGATSDPDAALNDPGGLVVFARGTDNAIWHAWQGGPDGNWSGWESLGGTLAGGPGAVLQTGGRLVVFARGTDNQVWHRWQVTRNGDWSGWESLGAPPGGATSDPDAALNDPAGLVVFARGTDNAIWHAWQDRPDDIWS
jgi:V8-like Glu-specific endopeptidase